jgi:hypothetical protein
MRAIIMKKKNENFSKFDKISSGGGGGVGRID